VDGNYEKVDSAVSELLNTPGLLECNRIVAPEFTLPAKHSESTIRQETELVKGSAKACMLRQVAKTDTRAAREIPAHVTHFDAQADAASGADGATSGARRQRCYIRRRRESRRMRQRLRAFRRCGHPPGNRLTRCIRRLAPARTAPSLARRCAALKERLRAGS